MGLINKTQRWRMVEILSRLVSKEVDRVCFRVTFEGEDLLDHSIDIQTLAPSFLAMANLVQEVRQIKCGEGVDIDLRLAAITGNCISFDLIAVQSQIKDFLELFSSGSGSGLASFLGVIGFLQFNCDISLIDLIRWLKHRKIKSRVDEDIAYIRLFTEDGDSVKVPKDVFELSQRTSIRKKIGHVVSPLGSSGISKIRFSKPGEPSLGEVEITSEDYPYFSPPSEGVVITENTIEALMQVDRPSLIGDTKRWHLMSDGTRYSNATMNDVDFLEKVTAGEIRFGSKELFRVKLKIVQSMVGDEISTAYFIEKIAPFDHSQRTIPLELPNATNP
jgi:hypothetical protein